MVSGAALVKIDGKTVHILSGGKYKNQWAFPFQRKSHHHILGVSCVCLGHIHPRNRWWYVRAYKKRSQWVHRKCPMEGNQKCQCQVTEIVLVKLGVSWIFCLKILFWLG